MCISTLNGSDKIIQGHKHFLNLCIRLLLCYMPIAKISLIKIPI